MSEREFSAGTVVAQRFRLERELGRGGMGAVWLAHDEQLATPAAVKFILAADSNGQLRERFSREARAAAQLRSPNVVSILAHGESDGVPYIAMEYLIGEDLAARIQREHGISPPATVEVLRQVARALMKAHEKGIVHRDLKPENIYLVADGDQEIAKVLDFGIAKSTTAELAIGPGTATGAVLGTPYYMSPEQARGERELDYRSDLFALGVIAYECLIGERPFEAETLGQLLMRIMVDPLPMPTTKRPTLPREIDGWFRKAVARDPAERFTSAKEMIDALGMALGVTVYGPPSALRSAPPPPMDPPIASTIAMSKTSLPSTTAPPSSSTFVSGDLPLPTNGSGRVVAGVIGVLLVAGVGLAVFMGTRPKPPVDVASPPKTAAAALSSAAIAPPPPTEIVSAAPPTIAPVVSSEPPTREPPVGKSSTKGGKTPPAKGTPSPEKKDMGF